MHPQKLYFYNPRTKQAELPLPVPQGVSRMITWERKLLSGRENWRKRSFSKGERLPRQEACTQDCKAWAETAQEPRTHESTDGFQALRFWGRVGREAF